MVEIDTVLEYSRRRKKEAAWNKIKSDLEESENCISLEGGISSGQLRENLGVQAAGKELLECFD